MKKLNFTLKSATFLCTSLFCTMGFAGNNPNYDYGCFDYSAVAMTPYGDSVSEFRATHGKVYHNESQMGDILLYGPLLRWERDRDYDSQSKNVFTVVYRDPDGQGKNSQVIGQLRYTQADGTIEIIKTLDSNSYSDASRHMASSLSRSDLDRRGGYYTIRIYLESHEFSVISCNLERSFSYSIIHCSMRRSCASI